MVCVMFLLLFGLNNKYNTIIISINEINVKLDNTILYNLNCNMKNVLEIINYLRSIGIINIKDLIIYKTDLFLDNKDDIINLFSKFNIDDIVNKINNNYEVIDELYD